MPLALKPTADTRWDIVSLGEVMLRFDPGEDRIARARNFRVWEGGGEYNVARALRRCFGLRSTVVTALVDNPVGRLIEDLMLNGGVDLSHLRWTDPAAAPSLRNGTYFLERGHGLRNALGVMDRAHTPIAALQPGEVDWDALFGGEGARCFHTGGILCALSPEAPTLALEAMQAARRHRVAVSFDCNYRPSLWAAQGGRARAIEVNRALMPFVDILFGHEGDLAGGEHAEGPPWHDLGSFEAMGRRMVSEFPNLQVIATSMRRAPSASRNHWTGFAFADGRPYRGLNFPDLDILDRVGGGDAFAAGLLFGLLSGRDAGWSLDCGLAHGALAMTTPGDSSMATLAEVERLMTTAATGHTAHVQR